MEKQEVLQIILEKSILALLYGTPIALGLKAIAMCISMAGITAGFVVSIASIPFLWAFVPIALYGLLFVLYVLLSVGIMITFRMSEDQQELFADGFAEKCKPFNVFDIWKWARQVSNS